MYSRISDLDSDERIFSADIYYHQKCFAQFLQNYHLLKAPPESKTKQGSTKRTVFSKYHEFIKDVLARGNGVSLSEILDLIKFEEETYPRDFEILGWCPAEPVLLHGEKVRL